jgi:hypothetical protein
VVALLVCGLVLGACPDEGGGADTSDTADTLGPDTSDTSDTNDTNESETSDTSPDGDGEDTADTGSDTDTSQGRTVAGTSFEGVEITWPATLTLCSTWSEGASLADEKARKVRLVVPPQTRTTLDEDALGAGRMVGLVLRTSPFATGRMEAATTSSRVTSWQILGAGGGGHAFAATVEHELSGKAGTLFEQYTLSRSPGAPDDVVVEAGSWEVTFAWRPFGSSLQPTRLDPCGGDPAFEDAVSVVTGWSGREWVTLLRFWRTRVGGIDAGSYPVEIVGHRIVSSKAPWYPTEVRGFWAHTYVAEHHNWNEGTEVDLAGDLGHWHHTLRNRAEGTEVLSKVTAEGVFGFDTAALQVEHLTDTGPVATRFGVEDARAFPRVDAAHLGRQFSEGCSGGEVEVLAAGGSDHVVQVVFCGGSRPEAVALVPVVWGSDPSLIGSVVEVATSESNAWSFGVGERDVTVFLRPDDYIELLVLDGAGEVVLQSYEPRGPLWLPEPRTLPVVAEGVVGGEEVALEIGRQWVTFGVGKSQIWAPTHFIVRYGQRTWHIESWDRLDYTNTHHNWEDELIGEADDGTSIRWKTSFMNGKPNLLTITGPGGEVILPETMLPNAE